MNTSNDIIIEFHNVEINGVMLKKALVKGERLLNMKPVNILVNYENCPIIIGGEEFLLKKQNNLTIFEDTNPKIYSTIYEDNEDN
jgi:hypothetical protein